MAKLEHDLLIDGSELSKLGRSWMWSRDGYGAVALR
jgi:hypothetical protein